MYYDNANGLLFVSPAGGPADTFAQSTWSLEPVSGGYKAEYNSGDITTTFYVSGKEITSIEVTSTYSPGLNGEYAPATN